MNSNSAGRSPARHAALALLRYCQERDWAGWDPYDALNSHWLRLLPFLDFRLSRLVLIQALKRCPVNPRPLLLIPRSRNPKGQALFLSSFLNLSRAGLLKDHELIQRTAESLDAMRSPMPEGRSAWGYSFPWQTRTLLVPRGAPNLVCTVFVADALLDLYESSQESRWLKLAEGAAVYLAKDLFWTDGSEVASFHYPTPVSKSKIHNANLLAAAFLARVSSLTGRKEFLEPALRAARYSAGRQAADGSWPYGEAPKQRWIDHFHTGYNLVALRRLGRSAGTREFDECARRGFEFYRRHFFRPDAAPKYFHDRDYPVDVHCVAQAVLTLLEFRDLDAGGVELAGSVIDWSLKHLWDPRGYFYHQQQRWGRVRIPYMRWGQAWMLLALSAWLEQQSKGFNRGWTRMNTDEGPAEVEARERLGTSTVG